MKTVRDVLDARAFPTFEKARAFLADNVEGFPKARVSSVPGDLFVIDLIPGIGVYVAPQLDPYADLPAAMAAETSLTRIAVRATPRTPTSDEVGTNRGEESEAFEAPEVPLYQGFHIDGDRRFWER